KVHFATANIGQYLLFMSMMGLGLMGMPRRYYEYLPEFQSLHIMATLGAIIIGVGSLLFIINLLVSWRIGPQAKPDPWDGAKNQMPDFLGEYMNQLEASQATGQYGRREA
ncbi:MAG: cbb3-type cytochrome c oxidase subunit I, partial [Nitrososphaerota archaeon]